MSGFKSVWFLLLCSSVTGVTGCGSSSDGGGATMDQLVGAVDAQTQASKKQADAATARKAEEDRTAEVQAAQPTEPEKKAVGSRPQMQGGGYLRAAGSARRHAMNVADRLAWIQGVRSFKAEEGRKPKNHDEFIRVVVPKYQLVLPKLEEDEEYLYDPNGESDGDFGQLYVVEKQSASAPANAPVAPAK